MDWVEERAKREENIRQNSGRLWEHLCTALTHAVDSYNKHYGAKNRAELNRLYENTVSVIQEPLSGSRLENCRQVQITLEQGSGVSAQYNDRSTTELRFMVADQNRVCLADREKELDEEAASKFFLTKIFFPDDANVKP